MNTSLIFAILIGLIFLLIGIILLMIGYTGPSEKSFTMNATSLNISAVPNAIEVTPSNKLPDPENIGENTGIFGSLLAYNINDAAMNAKVVKNIQKGWSGFRKDTVSYQTLKNSFGSVSKERAVLIKKANFPVNREVAAYFTWNVIEPEKGQYNWELTDMVVQAASESGVKLTAVVQPFAVWDQNNTQANPRCKALDFAYYDYKSGTPNDWSEYEKFLSKLVERYKETVIYWEIGNEVEGECGGFANNAEDYVKLLKLSFETIKKADPQAKVLNAGALEVSGIGEVAAWKDFWRTFFELGGLQYLDYFNLHSNAERSAGGGAKLDSTSFLYNLNFFNGLMEKNGGKKPIWITEFGTYSGTPSSPSFQMPAESQPSPQQSLPSNPQSGPMPQNKMVFPAQSQEFQAAWYFRTSVIGFANGVDRIFIDLIGQDNDVIGSSAAFDLNGEPRLFVTTIRTISSKLKGFSKFILTRFLPCL